MVKAGELTDTYLSEQIFGTCKEDIDEPKQIELFIGGAINILTRYELIKNNEYDYKNIIEREVVTIIKDFKKLHFLDSNGNQYTCSVSNLVYRILVKDIVKKIIEVTLELHGEKVHPDAMSKTQTTLTNQTASLVDGLGIRRMPALPGDDIEPLVDEEVIVTGVYIPESDIVGEIIKIVDKIRLQQKEDGTQFVEIERLHDWLRSIKNTIKSCENEDETATTCLKSVLVKAYDNYMTKYGSITRMTESMLGLQSVIKTQQEDEGEDSNVGMQAKIEGVIEQILTGLIHYKIDVIVESIEVEIIDDVKLLFPNLYDECVNEDGDAQQCVISAIKANDSTVPPETAESMANEMIETSNPTHTLDYLNNLDLAELRIIVEARVKQLAEIICKYSVSYTADDIKPADNVCLMVRVVPFGKKTLFGFDVTELATITYSIITSQNTSGPVLNIMKLHIICGPTVIIAYSSLSTDSNDMSEYAAGTEIGSRLDNATRKFTIVSSVSQHKETRNLVGMPIFVDINKNELTGENQRVLSLGQQSNVFATYTRNQLGRCNEYSGGTDITFLDSPYHLTCRKVQSAAEGNTYRNVETLCLRRRDGFASLGAIALYADSETDLITGDGRYKYIITDSDGNLTHLKGAYLVIEYTTDATTGKKMRKITMEKSPSMICSTSIIDGILGNYDSNDIKITTIMYGMVDVKFENSRYQLAGEKYIHKINDSSDLFSAREILTLQNSEGVMRVETQGATIENSNNLVNVDGRKKYHIFAAAGSLSYLKGDVLEIRTETDSNGMKNGYICVENGHGIESKCPCVGAAERVALVDPIADITEAADQMLDNFTAENMHSVYKIMDCKDKYTTPVQKVLLAAATTTVVSTALVGAKALIGSYHTFNALTDRVNELEMKLYITEDKLDDCEDDLEEKEDALEICEAEFKETEEKLETCEDNLEETEAALEVCKDALVEGEVKLDICELELENVEEALKNSEEDVEILEDVLEDVRDLVDEAENVIDDALGDNNSKITWPLLVGKNVDYAMQIISEDRPDVLVVKLPEGSIVTLDFRLDRVRVFYDPVTIRVTSIPMIG
jgi:hypothetical protein